MICRWRREKYSSRCSSINDILSQNGQTVEVGYNHEISQMHGGIVDEGVDHDYTYIGKRGGGHLALFDIFSILIFFDEERSEWNDFHSAHIPLAASESNRFKDKVSIHLSLSIKKGCRFTLIGSLLLLIIDNNK